MTETILFVDDEEIILNALEAVFSREGFQTLSAKSGEEALRILEGRAVDVVISDERMPGITGIELLSTVKKRYPEKIRIVLTAYAEMNTILSAVNRVEAHRLIIKPYQNEELVQTVRELISRRSEIRTSDQALEGARREADFAYRATRLFCRSRLTHEQKYEALLNLIQDYLRAETLSLMIFRPAEKDLIVRAATNRRIVGMRRPLHENAVSSYVARERKPCRNAEEAGTPPPFDPHDRAVSRYRSRAFLSVPVLDDDRIIGVFNVTDPVEEQISASTEETVSHLMRWVGAVVPEAGEPTRPNP